MYSNNRGTCFQGQGGGLDLRERGTASPRVDPGSGPTLGDADAGTVASGNHVGRLRTRTGKRAGPWGRLCGPPPAQQLPSPTVDDARIFGSRHCRQPSRRILRPLKSWFRYCPLHAATVLANTFRRVNKSGEETRAGPCGCPVQHGHRGLGWTTGRLHAAAASPAVCDRLEIHSSTSSARHPTARALSLTGFGKSPRRMAA